MQGKCKEEYKGKRKEGMWIKGLRNEGIKNEKEMDNQYPSIVQNIQSQTIT